MLDSPITAAVPDVPNHVGTRHLPSANELGQVREVQHDARRTAATFGENRRATIVREEDVSFRVLLTKFIADDLENFELGRAEWAALRWRGLTCAPAEKK